jgi:hypothetical protein
VTAARELTRRVLIWTLVAMSLALGVIMIVTQQQFWVLLGWSGFTIVGAIILNARKGNAIGRLLMAIGIYWPVYGVLGLPQVFAGLPFWVEIIAVWIGDLVWVAVPLIVVMFPGGRIETRLGRIVAWALGVISVLLLVTIFLDPAGLDISSRTNPVGIDAIGSVVGILADDGFVLVPIITAVSLVDLVVRWRASTGVRRLQFRWLAFGTAVTIVAIMGTFLWEALPQEYARYLILGLNAIPIAIGIAVTRYGLYEIGRVVSRTVSYVLVTALAVGVYAAIVTSATLLLPGAPAVGVALATLGAAALFLPALRSVQRAVDRRFDRERYDAAKTVDEFGERLRTGADPAATAPDLVRAVERTLQPAAVGVWTTGEAR